MWDDDKPKPKPAIQVGELLEALSINDLHARVTALEAEIARTQTEIDRKRKIQTAAENLFK